jgi:tRNA (guanine-N7-)-methyltransferase
MLDKFLPSFARQRTRTLKSARKKTLKQDFLEQHTLKKEDIKSAKNIILEIGSGNGETASRLAELSSNFLYIACEVFLDGIIQTCAKAEEKNIQNIRFFRNDARLLLTEPDFIKFESIDQILILFPDPWPKKRHHKRRLLNISFLNLIFPLLKKDGTILIATDHESYKIHIRELCANQNLFIYTEQEASPAWWVLTKYQKKALNENRSTTFFHFTKQS